MTALLLSALFAAAGALGIGAISASWARYGAAARAVRGQLARCSDRQELRFVVTMPAPRSAQVIRVDFSRRTGLVRQGRRAA